MSRLWFFAWFTLSLATVGPTALAYLDPASGSMFLQLLLGGVAGAALIIKLYWHKFLGLFGMGSQEKPEELETPGNDST